MIEDMFCQINGSIVESFYFYWLQKEFGFIKDTLPILNK